MELASQYVPPTPSRRVTSIPLMPIPAWIAVPALTLAPLAQLLPANNSVRRFEEMCGRITTMRPQYFFWIRVSSKAPAGAVRALLSKAREDCKGRSRTKPLYRVGTTQIQARRGQPQLCESLKNSLPVERGRPFRFNNACVVHLFMLSFQHLVRCGNSRQNYDYRKQKSAEGY